MLDHLYANVLTHFYEQLFVIREFQGGADMEVYNRMIKEVLLNPKFSEYFGPSSGVIPMQIGQ